MSSVALTGSGLGARGPVPTTEVVVTLKAPGLAVFGRRSLSSASRAAYLERETVQQNLVVHRIQRALPGAAVRWRYRLVADGFAIVVPRSEVSRLTQVAGVARVWPNVTYHALADGSGPEQIGANQIWGPDLATAGQGVKIGIIDDGLQATNPYFNPSGYTYPAGFPKGQTAYTTPKVIVARTFAPPGSTYRYANTPFDPLQSFHATHVAGIAAGDYDTSAGGATISGVAPRAYIGNYKALTTPTPDFGLDGNSAEIVAAIEAAVGDGMNVINLSLGEPEVDPQRDIVVTAIDDAARAGVVPVIAAGNDFDDFGYGSISSPANAPDAITVAAVSADDEIASFSSAGPTPLSLLQKPDVSAPGVDVLSSLPVSQGSFGTLSGTSMATPHVSGAAALLKQRHPTWTVAQIKSALVQSGAPVHNAVGSEVLASREGGGLVDLPQADAPLLFAAPTGLSFGQLAPGASTTQAVALTDAGGGAGAWTVTTLMQTGTATISVPSTITVPGTLSVQATAGSTPGDVDGFVVLTHGTTVRRIPFWLDVAVPALTEPATALARTGTYRGTTRGGARQITVYRYPTGGDDSYPGPERAYRVHITGAPANFGVAVLSGTAVPHVILDGRPDHLVGYTGLPLDLNPYRTTYGRTVRTAGAVLPAAGTYEIVFDTRSAAQAGPFTFRYWVNDTTPPRLRVEQATKGTIRVAATDSGSGVDPTSVAALLDGKRAKATDVAGVIRIAAKPGRHTLVLQVSDEQENKNMEDVAPVLPNTAVLRTTVRVPAR